jgi:hypothetical protein
MAQDVQIITASQIINFDRDEDADRGILRLEVDNRNDGLNAGKTSFSPGDSVGLLLYKSPNITILHGPIVTYGSIAEEGTHITPHEGFLAFAGETEQSLSHPICPENLVLQWVGNILGDTRVLNCSVVQLVDPPDWNPGNTAEPLADKIGILRYSGNATAQGYRLSGTNLPDQEVPYQIGIYIFGAANLPA